MKCDNCGASALFEYQITRNLSQFYCGKHLPKFLDARRRAGFLKITAQHEEEKNAALELLGVKPNVPDTVEEPEEAPASPAPKKKRKPKNETNS